MASSEITLYKTLRKKLGEMETAELIEFVKSEVKAEVDTTMNTLLKKEDKIELIDRFNDTKDDLTESINTTRTELSDRINAMKHDLIDRINKSKTETIIWIVGIGLLQFLLTIVSKKFL